MLSPTCFLFLDLTCVGSNINRDPHVTCSVVHKVVYFCLNFIDEVANMENVE